MEKPSKLKGGDHIAIVSLSSGILGEDFCKHQLDLGVKRLKEIGLNPVFMPNSLKGIDYIKNNPAARASDLKEAFRDQNIKGIICAIGGDDTYKTIPFLMEDQEFINLVKNSPKVFIGFSDSTNNHLMLNKLGLVTYYGLNFLSDICELSPQILPYTLNSYRQFFKNDDFYEIVSSPHWYKNRIDYSLVSLGTKLKRFNENKGHETLCGKGNVKGLFFGGCLESLYDIYTGERYKDQRLVYEQYGLIPNKAFYEDKILFVETSEEMMPPKKFKSILDYFVKIEILTSIKALIVGKPYDEMYYDEYKRILINVCEEIKLPAIYNVNFGHALPRAMIPYGVVGEVDFDKSIISVCERIFSD